MNEGGRHGAAVEYANISSQITELNVDVVVSGVGNRTRRVNKRIIPRWIGLEPAIYRLAKKILITLMIISEPKTRNETNPY